jgi:hypothetical protein
VLPAAPPVAGSSATTMATALSAIAARRARLEFVDNVFPLGVARGARAPGSMGLRCQTFRPASRRRAHFHLRYV